MTNSTSEKVVVANEQVARKTFWIKSFIDRYNDTEYYLDLEYENQHDDPGYWVADGDCHTLAWTSSQDQVRDAKPTTEKSLSDYARGAFAFFVGPGFHEDQPLTTLAQEFEGKSIPEALLWDIYYALVNGLLFLHLVEPADGRPVLVSLHNHQDAEEDGTYFCNDLKADVIELPLFNFSAWLPCMTREKDVDRTKWIGAVTELSSSLWQAPEGDCNGKLSTWQAAAFVYALASQNLPHSPTKNDITSKGYSSIFADTLMVALNPNPLERPSMQWLWDHIEHQHCKAFDEHSESWIEETFKLQQAAHRADQDDSSDCADYESELDDEYSYDYSDLESEIDPEDGSLDFVDHKPSCHYPDSPTLSVHSEPGSRCNPSRPGSPCNNPKSDHSEPSSPVTVSGDEGLSGGIRGGSGNENEGPPAWARDRRRALGVRSNVGAPSEVGSVASSTMSTSSRRSRRPDPLTSNNGPNTNFQWPDAVASTIGSGPRSQPPDSRSVVSNARSTASGTRSLASTIYPESSVSQRSARSTSTVRPPIPRSQPQRLIDSRSQVSTTSSARRERRGQPHAASIAGIDISTPSIEPPQYTDVFGSRSQAGRGGRAQDRGFVERGLWPDEHQDFLRRIPEALEAYGSTSLTSSIEALQAAIRQVGITEDSFEPISTDMIDWERPDVTDNRKNQAILLARRALLNPGEDPLETIGRFMPIAGGIDGFADFVGPEGEALINRAMDIAGTPEGDELLRQLPDPPRPGGR